MVDVEDGALVVLEVQEIVVRLQRDQFPTGEFSIHPGHWNIRSGFRDLSG